MKKRLVRFLYLNMLAIGSFNCTKDSSEKVYRGTIFGVSCEKVGIDIDGATGTGTGAFYKDHANAANIKNYCLVFGMGLKAGDVITFKISKENVEATPPCLIGYCLGTGPANDIFIHHVVKVN